MPDHPVITDRAVALSAENLSQFAASRLPPVIILWLRRHTGKASVVIRQILRFQIIVGGFVVAHLLPPQFLDQPILMNPMDPFDSALGLWRTSGDDPDAQLLTHAPELRHRHFPTPLLGWRCLSFVHILPVGIERPRDSIFLNPYPQHSRRRQ